MTNSPTAILLCAGRGSRMKSDRTHKVCFEIAGIPAVIRLIDNFKTAGVHRFVVVVGSKADKVMECLKHVDGVMFAYQSEQSGTGDAAICGLHALTSFGYDGPVIISMGDKIVAPDLIRSLIEAQSSSGAAISFLTQPKSYNPSGGRIVKRGGNVIGIVEHMDELRFKLMQQEDRSDAAIRKSIAKWRLSEKKAALLYSIAIEDAKKGLTKLPKPLEDITEKDLRNVKSVNAAVYYCSDAKTVLRRLNRVTSGNAQGEIYLTDMINLTCRKEPVVTVEIDAKEKLLTYSTMDELLQIQSYFTAPLQRDDLKTASDWIADFNAGKLDQKLKDIYGTKGFSAALRDPYINACKSFIERFGDLPIVISRAPGRVNLMGRHIEHRGGSTNILAINRETICVASPRPDNVVEIANIDPTFPVRDFSILDIISSYETDDWLEFIESEKILELVSNTRGDWANYVKAGILRLQLANKSLLLTGMNMLFSGNIPMAAGLSSSSSLVVASMEATIALNRLDLTVQDFVALSGEGEWFVGSRGGSGDHAAMKCGERGMITHMNFSPFSVGERVPWSEDYDILVANSGIMAKKSGNAKDLFNAMVATYELAFMCVLEAFPEYAHKLACLRDINAKNLGVSPSRIYEILLKVPRSIKREDLFTYFPKNYHDHIRQLLSTHAPFSNYPLRGALLYGLAECDRANRCIELLKKKRFADLGEMMCISHNGDRVWQNGRRYRGDDSDEYLYGLINDLKSEDSERVEAAQIWHQPGAYCCSKREIDLLIDFLLSREGVLGAQLSGAGLGGCVIALVDARFTDKVLASLNRNYYEAKNLPGLASVFTPVAGSSVL